MTILDIEQPAITGPGLYPDLPADAYHAHRESLSSSGARRLLAPSCPAKFRYEQDHGQPHKVVWDIGTAAHKIVLGDGPELVKIDAEIWNTNKVKAEVAEAREAGKVPLKPSQYAMVHAMADAIRLHPLAARLLEPGAGVPEQSLFWTDEETGVMLRCRPDWVREPINGITPVVDYKTADSAEPGAVRRSVQRWGYHQQDPWYMDGLRALGIAERPVFIFVVQEKTPPYLTTVVQLEPEAVDRGRELNRRAIQTYADCVASGRWPGYSDDIVHISLPDWALNDDLDVEYA